LFDKWIENNLFYWSHSDGGGGKFDDGGGGEQFPLDVGPGEYTSGTHEDEVDERGDRRTIPDE